MPSLDLVVWRLAGRDDQYDQANTGLPLLPEIIKAGEARQDWKSTMSRAEAEQAIITKIVASVVAGAETIGSARAWRDFRAVPQPARGGTLAEKSRGRRVDCVHRRGGAVGDWRIRGGFADRRLLELLQSQRARRRARRSEVGEGAGG